MQMCRDIYEASGDQGTVECHESDECHELDTNWVTNPGSRPATYQPLKKSVWFIKKKKLQRKGSFRFASKFASMSVQNLIKVGQKVIKLIT